MTFSEYRALRAYITALVGSIDPKALDAYKLDQSLRAAELALRHSTEPDPVAAEEVGRWRAEIARYMVERTGCPKASN